MRRRKNKKEKVIHMNQWKYYVKELQKDVEVPENVVSKFHETLQEVEMMERGRISKKSRKTKLSTGVKAASAAAAAVIVGGTICLTNPALAAKMPVIGGIFEKVESDVSYSGDFSNKMVLSNQQGQGKLTAESNGVKITATESYCDGYSLFITAKIQMEKGEFSKIPFYATQRFGETYSQLMMMSVSGKMGDVEIENGKTVEIQGKAMDNNTFEGMIKLDKKDVDVKDGKAVITLDSIEYDTEGEEENIVEGNWELVIPYTVDKESSKEYMIDKTTESGVKIHKVFVSPYQVVVFSEVPSKRKGDSECTREMFEQEYGDKFRGLEEDGVRDIPTYEDILEQKQFEFYELALFNQAGNALEWQECIVPQDGLAKDVFSVKGLDISKLTLYCTGDEENMFRLVKATTTKEAEKFANTQVEIPMEK